MTSDNAVKYPHINVQLVGENGNAFAIIGLVSNALRRNCVPEEEIDAFVTEATSGDYDHVIRTCVSMVNVT